MGPSPSSPGLFMCCCARQFTWAWEWGAYFEQKRLKRNGRLVAQRLHKRGPAPYDAQGRSLLDAGKELRVVAEIILRNICDKLAILAEYHDRTTVSEAILREALRSLEVRMDSYAVPRE